MKTRTSLNYQLVFEKKEKKTAAFSVHAQIACAIVLLVALSARVWMRVKATDLGYELAKERELTVSLDMERRELELQRSLLIRPDALKEQAEKRLALHPLVSHEAMVIRY